MSNAAPDTPPAAPLEADPRLRRLQRGALIAGLVGGLLCVVGAIFNVTQFLRAYLVAYVFWLSIALGSLGIQMLGHIIAGAWTVAIRRPLEAAARTLAPLALLFLPIALGLRKLYPWALPGAAEHDTAIAHKAPYLNAPFFLGRAIVYFAVWAALAFALSAMSLRQDRGYSEDLARRMRKLSAAGVVLYCTTMTLASIDWMMSLEPHFHSTIYGIYVIGGQCVAAMAWAVLAARLVASLPGGGEIITTARFHDLGKMLLAFMMLWSYYAFSQFLIVWAGNLPEEAVYYQNRIGGGLRWVSLALVILGFAVPFLMLLSRGGKRDPRRLTAAAALLLVVRWIDLEWLISPALYPQSISLHWLDAAALVAIGGVWVFLFVRQLAARPLVPAGDPLLGEVIENG